MFEKIYYESKKKEIFEIMLFLLEIFYINLVRFEDLKLVYLISVTLTGNAECLKTFKKSFNAAFNISRFFLLMKSFLMIPCYNRL